MQGPFSLVPSSMAAVEATISPARMARFSRATGGDKHQALRLCVWNARLCEEFYLPLQLAEVAIRNAISKTLSRRFGARWYETAGFTSLLTNRYQEELSSRVGDEKAKKGAYIAADDVIGALTFGFWMHLLTTRYDNLIWNGWLKTSFPNAHIGSLVTVRTMLERLRVFRNRVMHHYAIFDRSPKAEYLNILASIRLIDENTYWLLTETRNIDKVMALRPRI